MSNTYITVKEFAKSVNKTPQAIYKQLETRLKPYVIIENNKILINISAIEKFYFNQPSCQLSCQLDNSTETASFSEFSKDTEKEKINSVDKVDNLNYQPTSFDFNRIINALENELKSKDEQLRVKDNQILELNNRLAEITQLLNQQQQLSAIDKKKIAAATEEEKQSEPYINIKENKKSFFDFLKKFR